MYRAGLGGLGPVPCTAAISPGTAASAERHGATMTTDTNHSVELAWTLAQLQGALQNGITHALRRHGLSHAMLQAMIQLRQAPKRRMRMTELADSLAYSRSGITRLIDRLVESLFVVREHCIDDRRSLEAALT